MERYFPDNVAAARFLSLFYILWTVSISNKKFKPQFLQALAEWIVTLDKMKISSPGKFNLSTQTSNALQRILRCYAALIDPRNELFCKIHEQLPLKVISGNFKQNISWKFKDPLTKDLSFSVLTSENL